MLQNVSVKLLNKATLDPNGRLELYSELNNSFKVGDQILISGGRYDNTDLSSFTTTNPYTLRYKVISIDPSINKFTLNISPIGPLYFPYSRKGAIANQFGNPQDTVNPGYNYYNFGGQTNLGLGVYASTTSIVRGKYKKGQIYNAILGTDKTQLSINDTVANLSSQSKVQIQHAIFKNCEIKAGIIQNKSFGLGLACLKYQAIEDIGANFPLSSIPIGLSADNYGWSYYDRAIIGDLTLSLITIERNWINSLNTNPTTNRANTQIFRPVLSDCRIGDFKPVQMISQGGLRISNPTINGVNSDIRNFFNLSTDPYNQQNGMLRQHIKINVVTASYPGPAGQIRLDLQYSDLANQIYSTGQNYYLHSVLNPNDDFLPELSALFNVVSTSYTFGNQAATKKLIITIPSLVAGWASFVSTYPNPALFKWSNAVIYNLNSTAQLSFIQTAQLTNLTTIESHLTALSQTSLFIKSTNTTTNISKSVLNSINLEGLIGHNISSTTKSNWNRLSNVVQYTDINSANQEWNAVYSTALTSNQLIYQINTNLSYYQNNSFNNSNIQNTRIEATGPTILYNCNITGESFVQNTNNIQWEKCWFSPNLASNKFIGNQLVINAQFKGRSTKFTSSLEAELDGFGHILNGTKTWNLNTKKVFSGPISIPVSTEAIISNSISPNYEYQSKVVPVFKSSLNPSSLSVPYALYDNGDKTQIGINWPNQLNRDRLILYDLLTNATLNNVLNNVDTNTTSGVFDNTGGLVNPPIVVATASGLDVNFRYRTRSYNTAKTATNLNVSAAVFEVEDVSLVPVGFPQYTAGNPHVNINLELNDGINPVIPVLQFQTPTTTPGNINTIVAGTYAIQFTHAAWQVNPGVPATLVPNSFMEVEDVLYEIQPLGGGPNSSGGYFTMNHIINGNGDDGTPQSYTLFPNPTPTVKQNGVGFTMQIPVIAGQRTRITINFWITGHRSTAYTRCGSKTKQTYIWIVEA